MVAHSTDRRVVVAGSHSGFHGQFRHRLGALPVSLNDARAAQHPGRLGVLSRRRRCAGV
jgi:hypothetical protein